MNDGLELKAVIPEDENLDMPHGWWEETARMVNHGYERFCKKRSLRHVTMRQAIAGEVEAANAQRRAG